MRHVHWLRLLSPLLSLLASCAQVLDVDAFHEGSSTLSTGCGELPSASSECASCMAETGPCCVQATVCAQDASCAALESCFARCAPADADCIHVCSASVPYYSPALHSLEQCLSNNCYDACQLGCARLLSPTKAACFAAQPGYCEDERAAYASDPAEKWLDCQSSCHRSSKSSFNEADACGCESQNPGSELLAASLTSAADACQNVAPEWSCLGKVQWPGNAGQTRIDFRFTVVDFENAMPVPGVTVTPCVQLDSTCSAPLSPPVTTAADGVAAFQLERRIAGFGNFVGYFLLQGAAVRTTLYYFNAPPLLSEFSAAAVLKEATVALLATFTGLPEDPATGTLGLSLLDCNYFGVASGVVVTSDPPAGKTLYFRNGLPDAMASSSDASGQVALLNVPPGKVHLTATLANGNVRIGELDVLVRAGANTTALFPPTPAR